jgi:DNA repair exonuclease SbcCD ATPase subunit
MAEPLAAETIQQALDQGAKMHNAYGPLGASLGILQLEPAYQEMRDFLTQALSQWESLQVEIKAAEAYKHALDSHVAAQEQRRAELDRTLPPEERALQERLEAQQRQLSTNAEALKRQEASLFQNGITLGEQEDQLKALGQQVLGLQQQASRRAAMGVGA